MSSAETSDDPRAFPSVEAYRRGLPDGWRSYPECRARADLLGSLAAAGALAGLEVLGAPLAEHARPRGGGWIPEAIHVGVLLAVRDHRFPGPSGEGAFLAWLHRLNAEHLPDRSTLGPQRALMEFPGIWSRLHEGSELRVVEAKPGSALLAAVHPEPLFPPLAYRWRRDAIAAFLVKAGAVQPRVRDLGYAGDRTHLAIEWT